MKMIGGSHTFYTHTARKSFLSNKQNNETIFPRMNKISAL